VTQETNDKKQLMPMITTIEQQSGNTPTQLLADAGYCSDEGLSAIATTQIDAYISTRKQKHGERPGPCPTRPGAPERDDHRPDGPHAIEPEERIGLFRRRGDTA
jgi:hypothetical protein